MKIHVISDVSADRIMQTRNMGKDGKLQKYMASEVQRLSDPYVPMQSGHLKSSAQIIGNGHSLVYPGPYAHYQYTGMTMGPNYLTPKGWRSGKAPKFYTGGSLSYHGAPKRGPHWEKRMIADKGSELQRSIAIFIGGGK